MALKKWRMPKTQPDLVKVLAQDCEISPFLTEILVNRGITGHAAIADFAVTELMMESALALKDMDKAVALLGTAIDELTPIVIYGDYDCDGVTSTSLLYSYLSMMGAAVSYYIPNRLTEGYGMHSDAVKKLHEQGAKLLITVDNGISAHEQITLAKSLGMTVIVTDHHQVGETLPDADAVVNPHRRDCPSEYKLLAGVGVAFKLVMAMEGDDFESVFEQFGEFLTLGTVGDLMPLTGENRLVVQNGLPLLQHSDNYGIRALCEVSGVDQASLTAQNLAFGLIPRINAAGRMAHANLAVSLLLSEDPDEAIAIAQEMEELNTHRREVEQQVMEEIDRQITADPDLLYDRVLTFYHEDWLHGVIGVVSSRVLEKYGKPNLLMALHDGELTGSGRSVEFFPLYRALSHCKSQLTRYGGHTQAAGFGLKLEQFPAFKATLEEFAAVNFPIMPSYDYLIDKLIKPEEVTIENVELQQQLEPFGMENQQPLFLFSKVKLIGVTPVSEGKHIRLKLQYGSLTMTAMYFRMTAQQFPYALGSMIDFLGSMQINNYNGGRYLSIIIRDVHPHGFDQRSYFTAKAYYEMIKRGEPVKAEVLQKMIPSRDELAMLYRHLKTNNGHQGDFDLLFPMLISHRINYGKFRLMLDVLSDAKLIVQASTLDHIALCEVAGKVDLEQTETMRALKSMIQS